MSSVLPLPAEKPGYVAAMFGRIAPRYDLMNTVMTAGQDERWRELVAEWLDGLPVGTRVLDIGGGTGRLGLAVRKRHPDWKISCADFTVPMLRLAPSTLGRVGADAQRLPYRDHSFDAVVSGFLIRNVADLDQALREQVRVLRPGGRLVILETTPGPGGWLGSMYRFYFRSVVPVLGKFIAGDASAYTYLPVSTLAFVEPSSLAAMLRDKGVVNVRTRPLMLGSVAITSGNRPSIVPDGGAQR